MLNITPENIRARALDIVDSCHVDDEGSLRQYHFHTLSYMLDDSELLIEARDILVEAFKQFYVLVTNGKSTKNLDALVAEQFEDRGLLDTIMSAYANNLNVSDLLALNRPYIVANQPARYHLNFILVVDTHGEAEVTDSSTFKTEIAVSESLDSGEIKMLLPEVVNQLIKLANAPVPQPSLLS